MRDENGPGGVPAESENNEFDPYAWAKNESASDFMQNPGDLVRSCALQAETIIKANKSNHLLTQQALTLINLAAAAITTGASSTKDYPEADWEAIRKSLVLMYLTGIESVRLALATKPADASIDDAINEIADKALSWSGKKAAEARHNKPGGSRDLKQKICAVWATGKFSSRTICAEQEWEGLGFGSYDAARKALRNTPDPA